MSSTIDREGRAIATQRISDMIFMKAKFDNLANAAALAYLDLPDVDGDRMKACTALATDRWKQINDEQLSIYYRAKTKDDIFEAYLLYQADENFYKIFLTGPLADVPKDQAREFQDLIVEKFGSEFRHDKVQCTNWWFAKENKEAPFEVEDHKPAHVLTEESR